MVYFAAVLTIAFLEEGAALAVRVNHVNFTLVLDLLSEAFQGLLAQLGQA
jgi:hypothetical protein